MHLVLESLAMCGEEEMASWTHKHKVLQMWLPAEGGSFLNARKWSFYNAVFRSFFNAPGVISQRARAFTSCLNFVRAAAAFILQRAMVQTFCSPGFWVSGSLGFWVSWFSGLLVPWFLGFWVSWFLGFSLSLLSEFLVWVLNVTP